MSAISLLLPRVIGRLTPSGALPANAALMSQVAAYLKLPASPPPLSVTGPSWSRWVPWAAAAVAVLALAGLGWLRAPAGTIDPQLTLTNRDGRITYSGLVRDDASRRAIVSALQTTFGGSNVSGEIGIDRHVRPATWMPGVGDLLGYLKVPGVDFSLNGDAIGIGGWLSAAERQALTDQLRRHFGPQASIGTLGDAAADAIRAANDKALSALGSISTSGVSADALVQAMNLAIINFSTASAEVPADGMTVIRKAAEVMKAAPAGTMIEIGGHTDSTGDSASNQALSEHRAEAVKKALVSAGVPAAILRAKGYGASQPRATNDTEYVDSRTAVSSTPRSGSARSEPRAHACEPKDNSCSRKRSSPLLFSSSRPAREPRVLHGWLERPQRQPRRKQSGTIGRPAPPPGTQARRRAPSSTSSAALPATADPTGASVRADRGLRQRWDARASSPSTNNVLDRVRRPQDHGSASSSITPTPIGNGPTTGPRTSGSWLAASMRRRNGAGW